MDFIILVMSWVFEYCGTTNCQCKALKWFEDIQRDNEKVYEILNIGKLKNYTGKDFTVERNQLKFAHYIVYALEYYISQKSLANFYKSVAQSLIAKPTGRDKCLDEFICARAYFVKIMSVEYLIVADKSVSATSMESISVKFYPFLLLFVLRTIEEVYKSQENYFKLRIEEILPLLEMGKRYLVKLTGRLFLETASSLISIFNIFLYQQLVGKMQLIINTQIVNDYVPVSISVIDYLIGKNLHSLSEEIQQMQTSEISREDIANSLNLNQPIFKSGQLFLFKSDGIFTYRETDIPVFELIGAKNYKKEAVRYLQLVNQLGLEDSRMTDHLKRLPTEIQEWLHLTSGTEVFQSTTTTIDDIIM